MKIVLVSNGSNCHRGTTRASTEAGYIRAGKRVWPYVGLNRIKIKVYDVCNVSAGQVPLCFERIIDVY